MTINTIILSAGLFLTACSPQDKELCGTYQGTLPAASSPGIETTLTFNEDNSYTEQLVFIDEPDGTFIESGNFSVNKNIAELTPHNDEKSYYRIEKNQIRRLNADKKEVTGPLAAAYVLQQTSSCDSPKD